MRRCRPSSRFFAVVAFWLVCFGVFVWVVVKQIPELRRQWTETKCTVLSSNITTPVKNLDYVMLNWTVSYFAPSQKTMVGAIVIKYDLSGEDGGTMEEAWATIDEHPVNSTAACFCDAKDVTAVAWTNRRGTAILISIISGVVFGVITVGMTGFMLGHGRLFFNVPNEIVDTVEAPMEVIPPKENAFVSPVETVATKEAQAAPQEEQLESVHEGGQQGAEPQLEPSVPGVTECTETVLNAPQESPRPVSPTSRTADETTTQVSPPPPLSPTLEESIPEPPIPPEAKRESEDEVAPQSVHQEEALQAQQSPGPEAPKQPSTPLPTHPNSQPPPQPAHSGKKRRTAEEERRRNELGMVGRYFDDLFHNPFKK